MEYEKGLPFLCCFPVDEKFVLYAKENIDPCANTFKYWVNCLNDVPSDLLAFLQRFLLSDSLIPELSRYNPKKCHGLEVTVDEVTKVASSLISKITRSNLSISIAGYLYYDLSERQFSNGHLFEVGIINESIGNGEEAEVFLLRGKKISDSQIFPVFQIVFKTLLGQVYHKQQLYKLAEKELKSARKILRKNKMITCEHCILSLGSSIDEQFGDLYRYSSEKDIPSAEGKYLSALQKLDHHKLETSLSIRKELDNNGIILSDHSHGAVECAICASSGLCDDLKPRTRSRAQAICWRCLIFEVMEKGFILDIIYCKWECHHKRLHLRLLMKIANCKDGHDAFWKCISAMFYQKLPSQKYTEAHASRLLKHIGEESQREIFPIERATMKPCCLLANLQLPDVVPWLLSAFIIFREIPILFEKVSKLLALMLISKKRHDLGPFFAQTSFYRSMGSIFPSSFHRYLHTWSTRCLESTYLQVKGYKGLRPNRRRKKQINKK